MRLLRIVVFLFLFSSCGSRKMLSISGKWVVETIAYRNTIINECLVLNMVEFKTSGDCILPNSDICLDYKTISSNGKWELQETDTIPLVLTIRCDNFIFNGSHRLIFYKDEINNLFRMEIISSDLYVLCNKNLYEHGVDQRMRDQLVEISHRDASTWPKNN